MKRAIFFLLFLLSFPILFAQVYKSNALAQKIEEVDSLSGLGWELEDADGERKLYLDGNLYSTRKELPDGYEIISESSSERSFIDENGRVIRRIIEKGGNKEEYNYFYEDGKLISYTYSLNGELIKKVDYIFAGKSLASLSGENRAFFVDNYYVYEDGEDKHIVTFDDAVDERDVKKDYSVTEEGKLVEIIDGITFTYSKDGRIESEVGDNYSVFYTYSDEGALLRKESVKGSTKEVENYKDSLLDYLEIYDNGVLSKTRKTLPDGAVEEIRYISGSPRYKLIFDLDGRRLKEVIAL